MTDRRSLHGPRVLPWGRAEFSVWAPLLERVELCICGDTPRYLPLERCGEGFWQGIVDDCPPGTRYRFRLDGAVERPDPASRLQPEGVHAPSELTDPSFSWGDAGWRGMPMEDLVVYELHVGTFTDEGTFDGVVRMIPYLRELGVTAIELMPVSQFPGGRNWGYDGVYPYAPQDSYGGAAGLKRLVDACHAAGIAVLLDVVYNHLGPEGNYLGDFGPYFTDHYRTPWGKAINLDGPWSDQVRRFFIDNALYWQQEFHLDGLRLDAVHHIYDMGPRHFLQELAGEVHAAAEREGRKFLVIAECDLNDPRLVRPEALGGYGLDGVWCDDFHHSMHPLLTGEREGYYMDFGEPSHLARSFRDAYVYTGQFSKLRKRRQGGPTHGIPPRSFVVFAQNHDQVGNRLLGERLAAIVPSADEQRLAAMTVLLSPFVPLLFMGEEYGEKAPFPYFVSHGDTALIEAVRCGRREEFPYYDWNTEVPDPPEERTFRMAVIDPSQRERREQAAIFAFYREAIGLRRELRMAEGEREVRQEEGLLLVHL
ncbi:MAG TPA: malto-oligosyltrehalose trehalohydrolase, partial [Verrucomicrobiae bacterium]|nr:malto-oligosyltrehalose trehalohydrolase [Verrucomicrobiae bacterium]